MYKKQANRYFKRFRDDVSQSAQKKQAKTLAGTIKKLISLVNHMITVSSPVLSKMCKGIKILLQMLIDYLFDDAFASEQDVSIGNNTYSTGPYERRKVKRDKLRKYIQNKKKIINLLSRLNEKLKKENSSVSKSFAKISSSGNISKNTEINMSEINKSVNQIISGVSMFITLQDFITKSEMVDLKNLSRVKIPTHQSNAMLSQNIKQEEYGYNKDSPSFIPIRNIISMLLARTHFLEKSRKLSDPKSAERIRHHLNSLLTARVISSPEIFKNTIKNAQGKFFESTTLATSSQRDYRNKFKEITNLYEKFAKSNGLE